MAVKKKATKPFSPHQYNIDDVINKGGKTTADITPEQQEESETRFTLRVPQKLLEKIDKDRRSRIGSVSRNQWILEAISERLN